MASSIRRIAVSAINSAPSRSYATKAVRTSTPRFTTTLQQRPALSKPALGAVRFYSAPASAKVYDYEQVKEISEAPLGTGRVLIDVREPAELEEGYIPTAINIPIKSQPDALFLPEEEFADRFGFSKPATDKEVVFYCKSGVRSSAAAQMAQQSGYKMVGEYRGSWMDWQKQGGIVSGPFAA